MVLVITQETFNEAVQENIVDLGLTPEEALEEAVKQFESQGVDLTHIVKDSIGNSSNSETVEAAVKQLNNLNNSNTSSEAIIDQLNLIKQECDKGIQFQIFAGVAGAYDAILNTLGKFQSDNNVVKTCLKTMVALMTKQPDLLDDKGIEKIIELLDNKIDIENKRLALKWTKECCVLHEMNRQNLFNANIIEKLKIILREGNPIVLKEVLSVFRALILDDDVRVEFGRAHEHARIIAGEILPMLLELLERLKEDEAVAHDLILTLSALLVRAEFCQTVTKSGGITVIQHVMTNFNKSEKIQKQCFKLLKALAGNDECKAQIIENGFAPVIFDSLTIHKNSSVTVAAGLSCVAALSLRSPNNSKAFYETGLPEVIADILKLHPDQKTVQKNASWAIRNMVSRSRYQNQKFIDLGVEDLLKNALEKFKEIEYDLKAALRDLGCEVAFKEEWTGKGGLLTSGLTNPQIK